MSAAKVDMKEARALRDYRSAYFREYPGIFGRIWICSQCAKLLWGKENVQVDHIFALSKAAKMGKFTGSAKPSVLAKAAHQNFNLAAICAKCNKEKSDRVGIVTYRGYAAKVVEVIMFKTQDAIVLALWGGKTAVSGLGRLVLPKNMRPKPKKIGKPQISRGPLSTLTAGVVFTAGSIAYYGGKGIYKSAKFLGKKGGKALTSPLRNDKVPMWGKLVVVTVYALICYILWKRFLT